MSNRRVLVVGTSSDYIDLIERRFPQRALFITSFTERAKALEPAPSPACELLCDLTCPENITAALRTHLAKWNIQLSGIACFDCESMSAAAFIAHSFGLSYPSLQAVANCRDKYACKQLWQQAHLPCPDVRLISAAEDAVKFLRKINAPLVLKPLTGSGSELVFLCSTEEQCLEAFNTMRSRLAANSDPRMYATCRCDGKLVDPRQVFVAEEFVEGDEYSCDFIVDGARTEIIRIARKIPDPKQVFGTTLAYLLPGPLPDGIDEHHLRQQLNKAALTLGLDRAICMVDFVIRRNRALMIELAPRPGGDCLPPLILSSCRRDIIGYALDFAEGRPCHTDPSMQWRQLAGVRLFAEDAGLIEQFDTSSLTADGRVLECYLRRKPGHTVVLPPDDYDSRIIGHVIFEPSGDDTVENQSVEIASKINIVMKRSLCATMTLS